MKAAIYIRVSTEDQAKEGYSLRTMRTMSEDNDGRQDDNEKTTMRDTSRRQ